MEFEYSTLVSQGLAVGLVLYYIIKIMPAQNKRYDDLVDKIINGQQQCADKMNEALHEVKEALHDNSQSTDHLAQLIEKKIKD